MLLCYVIVLQCYFEFLKRPVWRKCSKGMLKKNTRIMKCCFSNDRLSSPSSKGIAMLNCWQKVLLRKGNFVSPDFSSFSPPDLSETPQLDPRNTPAREVVRNIPARARGWLTQWGVLLSARSLLQVYSTRGTGSPGIS